MSIYKKIMLCTITISPLICISVYFAKTDLKNNYNKPVINNEGGTKIKFDITLQFEKKSDRHFLNISLTNTGDDCECYSSDLPWSHNHSMTILIAKKNACRFGFSLSPQQEMICDNPSIGITKIKMNKQIYGIVDLDSRYPELSKYLRDEAVDLFWSYELCDIDDRPSNRLGGWIYIPRD
jgi:hypothetical protein